MYCIVSGFDPFGDAGFNPSQAVAERFNNAAPGLSQTTKTAGAVLPTCCQDGWAKLQENVAKRPKDEPFILILCGLGQVRKLIGLERFALNVREYRIADNRAHQPQEEYIDPTGPEAIRTRLPVQKLAAALTSKGYGCEVSNHAGTFVCNETYYRALKEWQEDKHCLGVLFVHLPSPEQYAITAKLPETTDVIEVYTTAIREIAAMVPTFRETAVSG